MAHTGDPHKASWICTYILRLLTFFYLIGRNTIMIATIASKKTFCWDTVRVDPPCCFRQWNLGPVLTPRKLEVTSMAPGDCSKWQWAPGSPLATARQLVVIHCVPFVLLGSSSGKVHAVLRRQVPTLHGIQLRTYKAT